MADRSGLKLVGFIFATVTVVGMLTTTVVVKGYADGVYTLDAAATASSEVRCAGRFLAFSQPFCRKAFQRIQTSASAVTERNSNPINRITRVPIPCCDIRS